MKVIISIFFLVVFCSVLPVRSEETSVSGGQKSEKTALYLSLASTLIPTIAGGGELVSNTTDDLSDSIGVVLVIGGLLIGPSVGHWYTGEYAYGCLTSGARLGITAAGGFLTLYFLAPIIMGGSGGNMTISTVIFATTIMGICGSAIYDIATAPASARHHNEKIKGTSSSFKPSIDANARQYGLYIVVPASSIIGLKLCLPL